MSSVLQKYSQLPRKTKITMKLLLAFLIIGCIVGICLGLLLPIAPGSPLAGKKWAPDSVWPIPFSQITSDIRLTFDPRSFRFNPVVSSVGLDQCRPLEFAIQKYNNQFLFKTIEGVTPVSDPDFQVISGATITVTGGDSGETECLNYPRLSTDPSYENYVITIQEEGIANIEAATVWGALRGIETFSQLIWSNDGYIVEEGPLHFYINVTTIEDYPRFPHRGLMIDTARHYQTESIFYEIFDGMMYNKLNVLHWHITDDQSFPLVSTVFPDLSAKGAYSSRHTYRPEMVQRIIDAGRLRGIRVLFELDTPGHTYSLGKSYPELLTPCYGIPDQPGTALPGVHADRENLDPTKEFTYTFMRQLFTEIVRNVSKDSFIHLGMDEVYPPCWESSPEIKAFMDANGYVNLSQVQEHYVTRHVNMVKSIGATPISWQDPLDIGVQMSKDVVIHMWKDWGEEKWPQQLQNVIDQGYRAILSSPWYINYINYGESWRGYYMADPILSLTNITSEQQKNVLGGEACIWAEYVDKTNIIPRLFPFVSAIAERLWSSNIGIDEEATDDARDRLDQLRCKLVQRGIKAQPLHPGFCGAWEVYD